MCVWYVWEWYEVLKMCERRERESDDMFGCMFVCLVWLIGWFGSDNKIGDEGGVSLGKALETNSTLTELYLWSEYDMSVYVCYVFG